MLASGNFQNSVDPPNRFDAVILILKSRLGTLLPKRTAVREYCGIDGRTQMTGTKWEYEDALAAARQRGILDLRVHRRRRKAEIDTWAAESRQAMLAQIRALDAFWNRHFAGQGSYIAGYSEFRSVEEFAAQFEQDLRRCVKRCIEAPNPTGQATTDRLWPKASFRELEANEFEDAPIFFGRDEAIGSALLRLMTNAQASRPFLQSSENKGCGSEAQARVRAARLWPLRPLRPHLRIDLSPSSQALWHSRCRRYVGRFLAFLAGHQRSRRSVLCSHGWQRRYRSLGASAKF